MAIAIVTGSAGLVGAASVRLFSAKGFHVVGIDNDLRGHFFGPQASTDRSRRQLEQIIPGYEHHAIDIRDEAAVQRIFRAHGCEIEVVIHAAGQPSHDWAKREPMTDFGVNATGTLVLLEAARAHCPKAVFIFTSTNKVYGDAPNRLPLVELPTRWEVATSHPFAAHGIDESVSIDQSTHSLFGVSKAAADLMVQEYGRYFHMKTGVFRCSCLTGGGHAGTEMHGFLSYLMRCCVERKPYTVYGYNGKQVRDNIHARDLVSMFWQFFRNPRPGEVYNAGGGRHSHCSMLEAITLCEEISACKLDWRLEDNPRFGDHIWYVSDVRKFRSHYPDWAYENDLRAILAEICEAWRSH